VNANIRSSKATNRIRINLKLMSHSGGPLLTKCPAIASKLDFRLDTATEIICDYLLPKWPRLECPALIVTHFIAENREIFVNERPKRN
jgi:hypothetical protein